MGIDAFSFLAQQAKEMAEVECETATRFNRGKRIPDTYRIDETSIFADILKVYRNKLFSDDQLRVIEYGLTYGLDVTVFANKEYYAEQMEEIMLGMRDGLDVSVYADPGKSSGEMHDLRMGLLEAARCIRYRIGDLELDYRPRISHWLGKGDIGCIYKVENDRDGSGVTKEYVCVGSGLVEWDDWFFVDILVAYPEAYFSSIEEYVEYLASVKDPDCILCYDRDTKGIVKTEMYTSLDLRRVIEEVKLEGVVFDVSPDTMQVVNALEDTELVAAFDYALKSLGISLLEPELHTVICALYPGLCENEQSEQIRENTLYMIKFIIKQLNTMLKRERGAKSTREDYLRLKRLMEVLFPDEVSVKSMTSCDGDVVLRDSLLSASPGNIDFWKGKRVSTDSQGKLVLL